MTGAIDPASTRAGGGAFPPIGGFGGGGDDFGSGDPFRAGYQAAVRRLTRYGLPAIANDAAAEVFTQVRDALSLAGSEVPDRGVELFVELVFVGASARANYFDDPLSRDDIQGFLGELIRIQNSWFHPPP